MGVSVESSRVLARVDYLRAVGRPNSYNVSGGIEAWEDAGLPIEH